MAEKDNQQQASEKLNEFDIKYLQIKYFWIGFGASIPILLTLIAVFLSYKSFQVANYNRLAADYGIIVSKLNDEILKVNALQRELDQVRHNDTLSLPKRFSMHELETRVIYGNAFLYFNGYRDVYSIKMLSESMPIIQEKFIPTDIPDTFRVDDQPYFIIAERRYDVYGGPDSVHFYLDSLNLDKSTK